MHISLQCDTVGLVDQSSLLACFMWFSQQSSSVPNSLMQGQRRLHGSSVNRNCDHTNAMKTFFLAIIFIYFGDHFFL